MYYQLRNVRATADVLKSTNSPYTTSCSFHKPMQIIAPALTQHSGLQYAGLIVFPGKGITNWTYLDVRNKRAVTTNSMKEASANVHLRNIG